MAIEPTTTQNHRDPIEVATRALLVALGENPDREGLAETPKRVARFWREFLAPSTANMDTAFECAYDELIMVSGIREYSFCEHHLLPFTVEAAVAYIPNDGRVLGLSKLVRIVSACSHRLQIQERLADDIADELVALSGSPDVAVALTGQHLCMALRGVRMPSATATTIVVRGKFRESALTKQEFLQLCKLTS